MFLSRYRHLVILGLVLVAIGFLFSSELKVHALLNHSALHSKKEVSKVFLEGEYVDFLEFIQDQPKEKKLEWKQFQEIHELGKSVAAILENLARISHKEARKCGADIESDWKNDRENIIHTDKASGHLFLDESIDGTDFQQICEKCGLDLKKGISILEISQKEGVEECFCKLKESGLLEKEENIFEAVFFAFLVHIGETSPKLLTKEFYLDLVRLKKSALLIKKVGYKGAYKHYKTKLASLLGLDMDSVLQRYLLKVALERRIYNSEDIQKVKEALLLLPFDKMSEIIHGERVEEDLL